MRAVSTGNPVFSCSTEKYGHEMAFGSKHFLIGFSQNDVDRKVMYQLISPKIRKCGVEVEGAVVCKGETMNFELKESHEFHDWKFRMEAFVRGPFYGLLSTGKHKYSPLSFETEFMKGIEDSYRLALEGFGCRGEFEVKNPGVVTSLVSYRYEKLGLSSQFSFKDLRWKCIRMEYSVPIGGVAIGHVVRRRHSRLSHAFGLQKRLNSQFSCDLCLRSDYSVTLGLNKRSDSLSSRVGFNIEFLRSVSWKPSVFFSITQEFNE